MTTRLLFRSQFRALLLGYVAIAACSSSAQKHPVAVAPVVATSAVTVPTADTGAATGTLPQLDNSVTSDVAAMPDGAILPLRRDIKKGTLANGLTYYILPHSKPQNRAYLWLAVNAGSAVEDDDQRGLAHLVEHMAFNGTKNFPKSAIVDYIEKIGMQFGADLNAYTSFDQTVYQLEVPTDDEAFVAKGLDILRDWAGNISFDATELEKERGVVLEEWRLGRGASARLFDKSIGVLFEGSRYAKRNVIGDPETIKKASRATVMRYYQDWYRPDLMAVIVVGEIQPADIEKMISDRFSTLANPATPRPRPVAGLPAANGPRFSIATDKEMTGTMIQVSNLLAHREESTGNAYRRTTAEGLYSRMLNQRLQEVAKRADSPLLFASTGSGSFVREIDMFVRTAYAKPGKAMDALRTLFIEVKRVETFGFTQPEFTRARTIVQRASEQSAVTAETNDGDEFADEITRNFFQAEMMSGRAAEAALTKKYLPLITLEEINTLVKSWSDDASRVFVVNGPDGKPLPNQAQITKVVSDVAAMKLEPWVEKTLAADLFPNAAKLTPGAVTATKTLDAALGITQWTLSNGVRVVIKPTTFENDKVLINGTAPGGLSIISDKDFTAVKFMNQVVGLGGLGQLDPITLAKQLAGKQVNVDSFVGRVDATVVASSSVSDLETAMQLIHLRMTALRSDPSEFAIWKTNTKTNLVQQRIDPGFKFSFEAADLLYRNNVRIRSSAPADVDKTDYAKSMALYRKIFSNAAEFTFVFTGSIKPETIQPLVEKYIGSLPSVAGKPLSDKPVDIKVRVADGVVDKTWKLGSEPKARVQIQFGGEQQWTQQDSDDMKILGDVLSIRLREILREDMSGVYGASARGSIVRDARKARMFTISFGCAPDRLADLVKATWTAIDSIKKEGVSADMLSKVQQIYTRSHQAGLVNNEAWASWLQQAYRFGDDPALFLSAQPLLARITNDNVKAAAARFLDDKHYMIAKLVPAK